MSLLVCLLSCLLHQNVHSMKTWTVLLPSHCTSWPTVTLSRSWYCIYYSSAHIVTHREVHQWGGFPLEPGNGNIESADIYFFCYCKRDIYTPFSLSRGSQSERCCHFGLDHPLFWGLGDCLVRCRMLNGIPGLHSLGPSSIPHLSSDSQKCL